MYKYIFKVTQIYVATIERYLEQYKEIAKKKNIKLTIANKKNILECFKYENEECLLSVGYRFIIPETIFSCFRYAINIHPSLLPKYRGAYSGYAIIENGEKESGITAHFIDKGIDTGDIINQKKILLELSDTVTSMSQKIMKIEPLFVLESLWLIKTRTYKSIVQPKNENEEIFNSKRIPEDSKIDSSVALVELVNKIRACDAEHYPAYFIIENKKVNIRLEFENEK